MHRSKKIKIICCIVLIFVVVAAVGICVWSYLLAQITGNNREDAFSVELNILGQNFTEMQITDGETAISAAQEAARQLGYENALAELQVKDESAISGDRYYKIQQYYRGVPVYGNFVTICADEDGTAKSMVTEVQDIAQDLSTEPKIEETEAREAAQAYFQKAGASEEYITTITEENNTLYIYPMSEKEHALAYRIMVVVSGDAQPGAYEVFVDAANGDVLCAHETVNDLSVQAYTSAGDVAVNASYDETAEVYFLLDEERGIYIHRYTDNPSSDPLPSPSDEIRNGYLVRTDAVKEDGSPDFGEEFDEGIYFLHTLEQIHDYFYETLDGENGTGVLHANYNDSYQDGKNARGGISAGEGFLSVGKMVGLDHLDAIAHEYTHYITLANAAISGEDGRAIREGISDIFGCLAEGDIEGNLDWKIEVPEISVYRNIMNPAESRNAETMTDADADDIKHHSEAYYYSTLISHAACLMWEGMDAQKAGAIAESELAELWYRAILMLPSRCSFEDCRAMVELSAEHMAKAGKLSAEQLRCVSWAFDEVGISWMLGATYSAAEDAEIILYDVNGDPYENYSISIKNVSVETNLGEIVYRHEEGRQPPKLRDLLGANAENPATYCMTVTDNQNEENAIRFYVEVSDAGQDKVEIYSCFGEYTFTDAEIIEAMERAADFAYGWFWDNAHVDHSDVIYSEELFGGTWPYERVIEEGISTKADLLDLTKQYYTQEAAEQMMSQKMWLEQNAGLYVSATEGLGGGTADSIEVQIRKDSAVQYTITVYEYLNGQPLPWGPSSYEIHYMNVNGYWVFDRYLLPMRSIEAREIENQAQYDAFSNVLDQVYTAYQSDVPIYSVYDMDGDGCKELLVKEGTAEFDFRWNVYVYDEVSETCRAVGDFDGGHSTLFQCPYGGVYNVIPSAEKVLWMDLEQGAIVEKEVQQGAEAMEPFMSEETLSWASVVDTGLLADTL